MSLRADRSWMRLIRQVCFFASQSRKGIEGENHHSSLMSPARPVH